MKNLHRTKNTLFTLSALFFIFSCSNKEPLYLTSEDSVQIELKTPVENSLSVSQTQLWHSTNKKICVLFGYDFNSEAAVNAITKTLAARYGLSEDGGLIYPLVYPDDFKHGGRSYISNFTSVLNDEQMDFCGIIILGAPEGTHTALARMQDFWEQEVPFPVFTIYPQDDVLGIESTSDFVLDKSHTAEITDESETNVDTEFIQTASDIITDCIDYMLITASPLKKNLDLQKHVSQMLKNHSVRHYIDPETGIQAINHFVLE